MSEEQRTATGDLVERVREMAGRRLAADHADGEAAILLGLCGLAEWEARHIATGERVIKAACEYCDCLAEFTETAAGNLSDCCSEHVGWLQDAVDAYRAAPGREE